MFGTTTLAEVKKKLIDRYGCLPDLSAEARKARQQLPPMPKTEMNELERFLNAALEALEQEINKSKSDQADEPLICFRENVPENTAREHR